MHQPPDDSVVFGSLLEAAGYATASNSDWVDIAAGNFCGGPEKELVLLKNAHSNFSMLRGPAPFASEPATSCPAPHILGAPSRLVTSTAATTTRSSRSDARALVHRPTSSLPKPAIPPVKCPLWLPPRPSANRQLISGWVDVAVGNFNGTGRKQIALLKSTTSNISLVRLTPTGELSVFHESDLDSSPTQPWKALAAGDIDGDGIDELIAVRQVSDGHSPTVLAYKWNGSGFSLFATSTFGNNGNSNWSSAAVGDFNGDGRKAIVLVKISTRTSSYWIIQNGATELRVLSTADLDSVNGQDWRGLAATNWLGGEDRGASQLIAVRSTNGDYRTNVFVYGDPFFRVARDTALEGTKAVNVLTSTFNYKPINH